MFGRAKVLLTIAACVLALPVAAEAPAPTTAFDGQYVGTATLTGGGMGGGDLGAPGLRHDHISVYDDYRRASILP